MTSGMMYGPLSSRQSTAKCFPDSPWQWEVERRIILSLLKEVSSRLSGLGAVDLESLLICLSLTTPTEMMKTLTAQLTEKKSGSGSTPSSSPDAMTEPRLL